MYYVYRIKSLESSHHEYIGTTTNVKGRVALHNKGKVLATEAHRPWGLTFYAGFVHEKNAKAFAHYLKSEEGQRFGRKLLWGKHETESTQ